MEGLARASFQVAHDPEVRAVLITGEGRAFCAGADLKRALGGAASPEAIHSTAMAGARELHHTISSLRRMAKPVLCAVNGVAAGAGVSLALAGDIIWAADDARFKLAYTAIGLSPDGGSTYFLPRAVGPTRALELLLTNRELDAERALHLGIVSRVVPAADLTDAARELAAELAAGPTRAFAEAKALVHRSLGQSLETQLEDERQAVGRSSRTSDLIEGVMAFVQKRPPKFRGA